MELESCLSLMGREGVLISYLNLEPNLGGIPLNLSGSKNSKLLLRRSKRKY